MQVLKHWKLIPSETQFFTFQQYSKENGLRYDHKIILSFQHHLGVRTKLWDWSGVCHLWVYMGGCSRLPPVCWWRNGEMDIYVGVDVCSDAEAVGERGVATLYDKGWALTAIYTFSAVHWTDSHFIDLYVIEMFHEKHPWWKVQPGTYRTWLSKIL